MKLGLKQHHFSLKEQFGKGNICPISYYQQFLFKFFDICYWTYIVFVRNFQKYIFLWLDKNERNDSGIKGDWSGGGGKR